MIRTYRNNPFGDMKRRINLSTIEKFSFNEEIVPFLHVNCGKIPSNIHVRKRDFDRNKKFNLEEVLEIAGAPMLILVFVHDSIKHARFRLKLSDERSKPLFLSHGAKTLNPGRRREARVNRNVLLNGSMRRGGGPFMRFGSGTRGSARNTKALETRYAIWIGLLTCRVKGLTGRVSFRSSDLLISLVIMFDSIFYATLDLLARRTYLINSDDGTLHLKEHIICCTAQKGRSGGEEGIVYYCLQLLCALKIVTGFYLNGRAGRWAAEESLVTWSRELSRPSHLLSLPLPGLLGSILRSVKSGARF